MEQLRQQTRHLIGDPFAPLVKTRGFEMTTEFWARGRRFASRLFLSDGD